MPLKMQPHALLCAITEAALSSARCHTLTILHSQSVQKGPQTYSEVSVVEHHAVKGHAV